MTRRNAAAHAQFNEERKLDAKGNPIYANEAAQLEAEQKTAPYNEEFFNTHKERVRDAIEAAEIPMSDSAFPVHTLTEIINEEAIETFTKKIEEPSSNVSAHDMFKDDKNVLVSNSKPGFTLSKLPFAGRDFHQINYNPLAGNFITPPTKTNSVVAGVRENDETGEADIMITEIYDNPSYSDKCANGIIKTGLVPEVKSAEIEVEEDEEIPRSIQITNSLKTVAERKVDEVQNKTSVQTAHIDLKKGVINFIKSGEAGGCFLIKIKHNIHNEQKVNDLVVNRLRKGKDGKSQETKLSQGDIILMLSDECLMAIRSYVLSSNMKIKFDKEEPSLHSSMEERYDIQRSVVEFLKEYINEDGKLDEKALNASLSAIIRNFKLEDFDLQGNSVAMIYYQLGA